MPTIKKYFSLFVLLVVLSSGLGITPVSANTLIVTNNADSGPGSLRQAVIDAVSGDTITFDNDYIITLTSEILITKTLTIDGGEFEIIISGNDATHLFNVSGTSTFNNLTFTHGNSGITDCSNLSYCGGAISVQIMGGLNINNAVFLNNHSPDYGGAIYLYGGWGNINNSTFINNTSDWLGGAIYLDGSTLQINNSTFSGNISVNGGALSIRESSLTLTNSTLSGNTATRTWAGYGGNAIYQFYTSSSTIKNSIFDNSGGNGNCVIFAGSQGGTMTGVNNLASDSTCGDGFVVSSSILLGDLGTYGGNTPTFPLLPGSAAINSGDDSICTANPINNLDQRGGSRTAYGAHCDIGAFESAGFTLSKTNGDDQSTPIGSAFSTPLVVNITANNALEPVDGGTITFTAPESGASTTLTTHTAAINDQIVTLDLTANLIPGAYLVNAGATGTNQVDFSLANLTPVTINQAVSQADPAVSGPIHFTAVFYGPVTGFTGEDIDLSSSTTLGTLQADVNEIAPNDGTTYDISVSGMTTGGLVIASLPQNAAQDSTGLGTAASTSTDNSVKLLQDTVANITNLSASPSVIGDSVEIYYTVVAAPPGNGTPTGTVTIYDGSNQCTASVTDGMCTITFSTLGTKILTAAYSGDSSFNSSTSPEVNHQVNKADTTTAITPSAALSSPSIIGETVEIEFTVSTDAAGAGTPTGNVTISDGTDECTATIEAGLCTITFSTAGTKTLTATYSGDSSFNSGISPEVPHQVNKADTSLVLDLSTTASGFSTQVLLTATLQHSLPTDVFTPNGDIYFYVNGNLLGNSSSDETGTATFIPDPISGGDYTYSAVYQGDDNFNGSQDEELLSVLYHIALPLILR